MRNQIVFSFSQIRALECSIAILFKNEKERLSSYKNASLSQFLTNGNFAISKKIY
jgi:hypothetical protein